MYKIVQIGVNGFAIYTRREDFYYFIWKWKYILNATVNKVIYIIS